MRARAFGIAERLLDLKVDVGSAPVLDAAHCWDDLLLRLVQYGVRFDEDAIYGAAETGALNGAVELAHSFCDQIAEPKTTAQIAEGAMERAVKNDAVRVESGKLVSYLTADQYRERAKMLREFADRLQSSEQE